VWHIRREVCEGSNGGAIPDRIQLVRGGTGCPTLALEHEHSKTGACVNGRRSTVNG
jgi:hypothetical protein